MLCPHSPHTDFLHSAQNSDLPMNLSIAAKYVAQCFHQKKIVFLKLNSALTIYFRFQLCTQGRTQQYFIHVQITFKKRTAVTLYFQINFVPHSSTSNSVLGGYLSVEDRWMKVVLFTIQFCEGIASGCLLSLLKWPSNGWKNHTIHGLVRYFFLNVYCVSLLTA